MFLDSCIGLFIQRVCRENSERKDRAKPGADGGGLYTKDLQRKQREKGPGEARGPTEEAYIQRNFHGEIIYSLHLCFLKLFYWYEKQK